MKLRREVREFAEAMETKLRKHDRERGKRVDGLDACYCMDRIRDEMGELEKAYRATTIAWTATTIKEALADTQLEAIDVANFAMMLWHAQKPVEIH